MKVGLVAHETADNVSINASGHIVSAATATNGMALQPGLFSAGSSTFTVTQNLQSHVIPLPLYSQVRPVIIEIQLTGNGVDFVGGINGVLNGIAIERNIDAGFPPLNGKDRPSVIKSGSIEYNFERSTNTGNDIWYTAGNNLLGINGEISQMLDLDVAFNDSGIKSFTFNLTNEMNGYHTEEVEKPWYILLTLGIGSNMDIEIVDWKKGTESWLIAK